MGEHSGISSTPLYSSHWSTSGHHHAKSSLTRGFLKEADYPHNSALPVRRGLRILGNQIKKLRQYQEQLVHCLTVIGIAALFLTGTYFFLVQLADYGW